MLTPEQIKKEKYLKIVASRKGYRHSKETIEKIRNTHRKKFPMGRNYPNCFGCNKKISYGCKVCKLCRRGKFHGMYGKTHTDSVKKYLSKIGKGRRNSPSTEFKKGRKHTQEWKEMMSKRMKELGNKPPVRKGILNNQWKGGVTSLNEKIRKSLNYKLWRKSVFERDKYTCVMCGIYFIREVTGKIVFHADHIKPFSLYPKLRFDINNGRTLCKKCHIDITKEQMKNNMFINNVKTRFSGLS
jgi:hypothetical protein